MNSGVLGIFIVLNMLPHVLIFEVYIRDTRWVFARSRVRLTVGNATSSEFLELHYVLGEGAGFVGEDIVYHAELFV